MKCYSVKVESLVSISDRAFKLKAYDGGSHIIPKSQVMGYDASRHAYWIAAWIVESKGIQHSPKHWAEFSKNGKQIPRITKEVHIPEPIDPITESQADADLIR